MTATATDRTSSRYWHERAVRVKPETRLFIGGKFVDASSGARFQTLNPATRQVLAEVAQGAAKDVDLAVAAAKKAFRSGIWSRMAPRSRMDVMFKIARLLEQYADDLALLDCLDMGKPISELVNIDVPGSVMTWQYFAETIDKIEGAVTSTDPSALHMITREPLGVVGCVVPWNYPLMMASWKAAPALAAGNSVVLKPAEQSPLSALLLARLLAEAGVPDGVFNVVNGYGEDAGRALGLHMDVNKIAFTGSTEVGKLMMVYAGQSNMKRVSTECGGKTPQIILRDVGDLDTAVRYAVNGIYGNQGEVCNAGSRLLVQESLADAFIERFRAKAAESFQPGNYVAPTLFTGVKSSMKIAQEEIFGPVAAVIPFKDVGEATRIANDSIYGLAASIWTSDLTTAHRLARDVEAGVVWINCFDHGDMTMPFGGYKQSGQGRDKCFETVLAHTQTKSIWINLG